MQHRDIRQDILGCYQGRWSTCCHLIQTSVKVFGSELFVSRSPSFSHSITHSYRPLETHCTPPPSTTALSRTPSQLNHAPTPSDHSAINLTVSLSVPGKPLSRQYNRTKSAPSSPSRSPT